MAAIVADSPEGLVSLDPVAASSDATYAGWFYTGTVPFPAAFRTFHYVGNDPVAFYTEGCWVGQSDTGAVVLFLNATATTITGSVLPDNTWVYVVYRRIGTSQKVFVNDVEECSAIYDMSAETHTHWLVGTDTYVGSWQATQVAYARAFTAGLLDTPMYLEQTSPVAIDVANLWTDTPLFDDLLDDSGNGHDWSESGGTITFYTPVNNTIATAIDLATLPATVTGSLVAFYGWYKYTSSAPEQVLGMLAWIVSSVNPRPFVTVYLGPEGAPTVYLGAISQKNSRLQIPVANGTTYYFKVESSEQGLMDSFNFEMYVAPNYPVVARGVPIVNSDEDFYPTAFIDPATGMPLGFRLNTVSGETADITSTGISLFYDAFHDPRWNVYDRDMNLLSSNAGFASSNIGINHFADHFYAVTSEAGQAWIRLVTIAGVPSTRWGPLTPGTANLVSVNRDETIAYYLNAPPTPTAGSSLRRWDLVNDVALSDFPLAIPAGYRLQAAGLSPGALLILGDDSIVVGMWANAPSESRLRKYRPDGTLLWDVQYGLGAATDNLDRVAHDPDDDTNFFWAWIKEFGLGKFQRINAVDGSVDTETPYGAEVQDGGAFKLRYDQIANTFGHPFSCPFVISHAASACPGERGDPREDGLTYTPPIFAPCEGTGTRGDPRTGA